MSQQINRRDSIKTLAALGAAAASPFAFAQKPITVGVIYVGPRGDYGWNQSHAVGAAALKALPGVGIHSYFAMTECGSLTNLPPAEQWPELIFELPELAYPPRLNCAAAFVDAHVAVGHGDVREKGMGGKFIRAPELAEVPYPVKMEPNLVVEFYAS